MSICPKLGYQKYRPDPFFTCVPVSKGLRHDTRDISTKREACAALSGPRDDMHQHLTNRLNQLIVDEAPDVADAHFLAHSDPLTELGGMLEDVRREREQRDTSSSRRADATIASALRTRAPPDRIHHHSEQTGEQEVKTLDQQILMILLRGRPTHPTSPSPAG